MSILMNDKLIGAVINGTNQTARKTIREWINVQCTGRYRINRFGNKLAEVIDPSVNNETRWLNFNHNFTGEIIYTNKAKSIWQNGNKVKTITDIDKLEVVREYFNMSKEDWETFVKTTDLDTLNSLMDECIKEVQTQTEIVEIQPVNSLVTISNEFASLAMDFESSDGYSRQVNPDTINTQETELYTILAMDFESSDGITRYN